MNRTERLYKIKELLHHRTAASFSTLQSALEVSRSTLKRDLSYLDAWCHLRQGLRNFALDAITQVVPLAQKRAWARSYFVRNDLGELVLLFMYAKSKMDSLKASTLKELRDAVK